MYLSCLFGPDSIHVNELCKIVNIIVASSSFACNVKIGSEYDASPRCKLNAEIEIESIHVFGCCVKRASRPCTYLRHLCTDLKATYYWLAPYSIYIVYTPSLLQISTLGMLHTHWQLALPVMNQKSIADYDGGTV